MLAGRIAAAGLALVVGAGAATQPPTTVTLSQSAGAPGANVTVPIYLAPAEGVSIGSLDIAVRFPPARLTFLRAERSGLSEGLDVALDTTQSQGPDPETSLVQLRFSASRREATPEPLPDGPLGHVVFTIAADADPGQVVTLVPTVTAHTLDDPPRRVSPIDAPDGQVVVSQPGITSCFFYMH